MDPSGLVSSFRSVTEAATLVSRCPSFFGFLDSKLSTLSRPSTLHAGCKGAHLLRLFPRRCDNGTIWSSTSLLHCSVMSSLDFVLIWKRVRDVIRSNGSPSRHYIVSLSYSSFCVFMILAV